MTVLESLKKRAGFLVVGGVSFALALGVTRYFGEQPLVQPQSDLGILLGLALVMLFFVHNDTRENSAADHASKTGLN
jgi:hypothetical protein